MSRRGSYYSGFAPRDFVPQYPQLWRGCVGAWGMCLGPTGLALRDWSGRGNHGTLTNFTLSSAWNVSQGGYNLLFDGSNDYVDIADADSLDVSRFTIGGWINIPDYSAFYIIASKGVANGATSNNFELRTALTSGFLQLIGNQSGAGPSTSAAVPQNTWTHVAGSYDGTTSTVYINGQALGSSGTLTFNTNAANMAIGRRADGLMFKGNIDDFRLYNECKTPNEIKLLATRRGIAYEPLLPRRHRSSTGNRRRRVLVAGAA